MHRGLVIFWTLSTAAGLPVAVPAQVLEALEPQQSSEARNTEHKGMPAWIKLGGELRGRVEAGNTFDSAADDQVYLNRLRFEATIQPTSRMRFFLQGQDARVVGPGSAEGHEAL